MKINNIQKQDLPLPPKSQRKMSIHPVVWTFFVGSTLLFIVVVFMTTVTSHKPVFNIPKEIKEKLVSNSFII